MTDDLLAYAAYLDRDPACTCIDSIRGLDRAGCPAHDPAEPPPMDDDDGAAAGGEGE